MVASVLGRILISWLFLYLVVSCASPLSGDLELISNRAQSWKSFVALIKLKSKPLLSSSTVDAAGHRVIDKTHLQELMAEQERVVAELEELSSEIEITFRYRLVLNGLAIIAPETVRDRIQSMEGVAHVESESLFNAPELVVNNAQDEEEEKKIKGSSTAFIGSKKVHDFLTVKNRDGVSIPVRGEGIRVGVIDSGIDYTHKMFGGEGQEEDYKSNDPTIVEDGSFPTRKVIAGIDLVGADYDTSLADFAKHIPHGDPDPLDEGVHGTHVAGTVAGVGDGVNTYDGVAPDASLLAIKVFGGGSTGESVIIKAIEYAIDPDGDLKLDDQAHVVNLSLGSPFGGPYSLYQEAISTTVRGGTAVVASAGNEGPEGYIVSSPSAADDAISVGASIDDSAHNWKLRALKFSSAGHKQITTEAVESHMGKPIAGLEELIGTLYHIGLADADLSDEQKMQLSGKIALIDRGLVSFVEKIDRAVAAGAIAVVMVNNTDGQSFRMGGDKTYEIPAVMIAKKVGDTIKTDMADGAVRATFSRDIFMERKELIDTLADFSSHGPRGFDSIIKPEVIAPGVSITSALAGGGDAGVKLSGTSMSSPHVSGVIALIRQYRREVSPVYIKSMLLGRAKNLSMTSGGRYAVHQQGGGRVDAMAAVTSRVVFHPATLSLGRTIVANKKKISGGFGVQNLTATDMTLGVRATVADGLTFDLPAKIDLKGEADLHVDFNLMIDASKLIDFYTNLDGYIELLDTAGEVVAKLPILLGVKKLAKVSPVTALIHAGSAEDSYRAVIDIELTNSGPSAGKALLFNLLDIDERKERVRRDPALGDNTCDLQSAGYRVITPPKGDAIAQFAVKVYYPLTTWNSCLVSIQLDGDGDGISDQELIASPTPSYMRSVLPANPFISMLVDAHKMRAMRLKYETEPAPAGHRRDYSDSVISFLPLDVYDHSTLVVVSARLKDMVKDNNGDLHVKLAAVRDDSDRAELDDYLGDHIHGWQIIAPNMDGAGFWQIPDHVLVPAGGQSKVSLLKGGDPRGQLVAYFPHNASTFSHLRTDYQSKIIKLSWLTP